MKNLKTLSLFVLETLLTDCLLRMESNNSNIEKHIELFKNVELELINRRDDKL